LTRAPCTGFGFFDGLKLEFLRGGDGGSSFFDARKLIMGMPRREVANLEEDDDPDGFGAAIIMETVRFGRGGRCAMTLS
jgi:hypothetical protein